MHCPGLTNINLGCILSQGLPRPDFRQLELVQRERLAPLAEGCLGLVSINLNGCLEVADAGPTALAKGCPGPTHISLDNYCNVANVGLVALARGCSGLTCVNLMRCVKVTATGVVALAREAAEDSHPLT